MIIEFKGVVKKGMSEVTLDITKQLNKTFCARVVRAKKGCESVWSAATGSKLREPYQAIQANRNFSSPTPQKKQGCKGNEK